MKPLELGTKKAQNWLIAIAFIELWLSFIVYDFTFNHSISLLENAGIAVLFTYFIVTSRKEMLFSVMEIPHHLAVIFCGIITCIGMMFGAKPLFLFLRLLIAYFATVGLQRLRIWVLKKCFVPSQKHQMLDNSEA